MRSFIEHTEETWDLCAIAMVSWYLALATTKAFSYETYFYYLDEDIFEAILFLPSIAFLAYIVFFTIYQTRILKREERNSNWIVSENSKVCCAFVEHITHCVFRFTIVLHTELCKRHTPDWYHRLRNGIYGFHCS